MPICKIEPEINAIMAWTLPDVARHWAGRLVTEQGGHRLVCSR